jgi:OOP family OmpA-OmpF porin
VQNRRVEILAVTESALDRMLFPDDALFENKSASLTEEGRVLLEEKRLQARDLLNSATYVEIVGHTDNVGDENDNMELSKKRAKAVRDYLVGQGLDGSKVFVTGKGGTMPIAGNDTVEGRAQNNRIQVLILSRVKE